jgi:response regulator of citrate/malate metabolism
MEKIERKQRLSEFDARLRELVRRAPDPTTKSDLNRALHFYRKRFCTPFEKKKEEVLKKIADGASSFDELCEETGFARRYISKILDQLVQENRIRSKKVSYHGTGRPRTMYLPL